jgi:putative ABC transport system permease protein
VTVESGGHDRYDFTVTGVLAPIPDASSLQFDFVLPFRQYDTIRIGSNDWGGRTSLYLLLAEGQSADAFEATLPPFTAVEFAERIEDRREAGFLAAGDAAKDEAFRLVLQPLRALHLTPEMPVSYEQTPHNPLYSTILIGIALLVLGIACINFVILSVGRSTGRAREVGVRKTLGAQRGQLVQQFWGEALLMSLVALGLGVALAALALPAFNSLTGQELTLGALDGVPGLVGLGALVLVVALLAGSYPALVLSGFQPVRVLKGGARARGTSRFTRGLVVLQYALSIALIVCTLVIYQQLDYLLNRDLGFRSDQIVVVHTPGLDSEQRRGVLTAFRDEVEGRDGVTNVVRTAYSFTRSYDTYGWIAADGTPITVHNFGVDYDYLDLLGMKLAAGRNFSPDFPSDSTQSVIVNEAFVREYAIADPIGHVLTGMDDTFFGTNPTIIGVVKDFHFESLHDEVAPAMLNMHPDYYVGMNHMLAKVAPDALPAALASMEATWARVFPDRTFSYSFLDEDMAAQYEAERRWRTIFTYASGLALLVACLGLFGLATLVVARRRKEIGVRKVLGASAGRVALLVVKDFALLVGIATVLAWPLAFAGMRRWLADFAYHIDMPWWVFPAAGGAALMLALATVSYHALRAATSDPVKSLRYE